MIENYINRKKTLIVLRSHGQYQMDITSMFITEIDAKKKYKETSRSIYAEKTTVLCKAEKFLIRDIFFR